MSERGVPGWLWVVAPALLLSFVGFLFYLRTLPVGDELDAVKGDAREILQQGLNQAKAKAAEKAADDAKPAYDFYRLLEQQKVEAPKVEAYVSTPEEEIDYQYILQAGSFRKSEDADRMRANLLLLGLDAYQERADVSNGTWYRVFVGPFSNRSRLNKAQDILVSNNISPLVLKRPLSQAASGK